MGVCLLCDTLSCGVSPPHWPCLLSVYVGHSVVVYSLLVCFYYVVHCLLVWFLPSGLVCCQFMVVTLLLFIHYWCVFIMWYIVLWCGSCPSGLACCQFMMVTLLLFIHCGWVFIMWYIVLWCGAWSPLSGC